MNFARERAHELWQEITPLLHRHKDEIAHYKDIALDPDVERYCALEESGLLRCYTARTQTDELVGYAIFVVNSNMHYKSSKQAVQDVLYLAPECRHNGAGTALIGYCDLRLKDEGVVAVYHHVKVAFDFSPMLKRMGYELIDYVYGKRL